MPRAKAELIDGMYVVGDLAYLPEEWERLERRRARDRAYYAANREKRLETTRRWNAKHPELRREINRKHMRRKRTGSDAPPTSLTPAERLHRRRLAHVGGPYRALRVTASLHELRCTGPNRETGCRCRKTLVVREVHEAAA